MPWILTHIILVIGFLLGFFGLAILLTRSKQRQGIGVWIFWMLVVPYVAVPLYLFLGDRKYRKIIREKGGVVFGETEQACSPHVHPLDALFRNLGLPAASRGNALECIQDGVKVYETFMKQIEEARESIFIETFVFKFDATGRAIFDALVRKAQAGVTVCLMIDGLGSMHVKERDLKPLVDEGGQAVIFLPVMRLPFHGNTNTRDHRKIAIFDRTRVIAGGSNLADEYMGPTANPDRWQDFNILLEGPAVRHYLAIFQSDWEFAGKCRLESADAPPDPCVQDADLLTQVVPSGPDIPSDSLYYGVINIAYMSQRRFWLATPYFVPDDMLCEAICMAARRGVDVRIIVPHASNHAMTDLARSTYLRRVAECGGTVVRYTGGMFHGKTVLSDDQVALVGSMNADRRSLFINFEVMLAVYDAGSIEAIEEWNRMLISDSVEGLIHATRLRLLYERFVGLIAPQL
ncbi:MAG: phospholipase D-like domain-containing protein [Phycisphaerales bacterium]|nr:phospholipase D-like domain-containing protein [Phycisphaerales bacterium]